LTHFLKDYIDAHELFKDENFLPAADVGHDTNPNVIGIYMGKEWEYVEEGSVYVRPVDGEMPPVLPHRR
jgi:hypothetical protein